ncbi:MAG: ExeM/NucH family extracellular endonuclease [Chloroflexi bacterium]|nr:ExeM/NucH family extracellular endonuclease [Chloroflexota bacterium]
MLGTRILVRGGSMRLTVLMLVLALTAITFSSAPTSAAANGAPLSPVINEFSWSHTGTDTNEYMEVYAEPNTDLSTLTLVIIEGDSGSTLGNLVRAVPVGTTDASGFWWTGFVATDTFQNGSQTGLLVEGFSGTVGTDLDTNNDGTLDSTPWTNILDGVAVNDNAATDKTYTPVVLLPNYDGLSTFIPGGASRIPNGTDTDAVADWARNDFELAGIPGFPGTLVAGEALNTPGTVNLTTPADVPPTVSTTSPLDNAVDVAVDTNVTITFSEPVSVTDPWFTFSCTTSGSVTPSVSGGPTTFTLDPASNLALNETCTITVTAAQVADQDGTPDAMAADYTFDFTTTAVEVCSTPFTPIYTLQEAGSNFGLAGTFTVEGIVTGDFQNDNQLDGFFLQDATGDGNPVTSDGIFVFDDQPLLADVVVGQRVRVTGTVSEFTPVSASATQTRITPTQIVSCGDTGAITTVSVTLPFADPSFAERYESMRVNVAQTLDVTEVFSVGRFGQVGLSSGARLENPTNEVLPGAPANAMAAANDLNYLVLDDGNQRQNPDPAPYLFGPEPTLRNGDRTTDLTGILTYMDASPDATTSAEATGFRLYPTLPVTFTRDNPRPTAPVNGGTLRVISFNVLNYFNGDGVGGGFPTSRGASTALEFQRQSDKIVAAIDALDPAIAGLIEIENDTGALSALADLVNRLNAVAGAGTYAYVETGVVGTDEIKVAFIYQPAIVTPVGTPLVDLNAIHNRPPVVQLFEQISTGARFNVVVNHFKSKGCDGATGLDLDQGDGQSCFNARRVQQAQRLITFLTTTVIPQSGDQDVLIIGDLNAYLKEDPIAALEGAGYTNLTTTYISDPYSYLFDGEYGTLDHALATASMAAQVHDVNEWHINADEPIVLDYNMEFKSDAQDLLNVGTPYRSSDHDPIVVDLGALTPEEALLSLQLTLEARSNPAPHPSYVVTANVKIAPQGGGPVFFDQDFVSTTSGVLVVDADLAPGSYTLTVKGSHTLARQFDVTVVVGNNNIPTPLLAEGDATDNNIVNISDFSVLAFAFGTSSGDANYDARADFNGDSLVNISDFSLLATHWAETGDGGVGP